MEEKKNDQVTMSEEVKGCLLSTISEVKRLAESDRATPEHTEAAVDTAQLLLTWF